MLEKSCRYIHCGDFIAVSWRMLIDPSLKSYVIAICYDKATHNDKTISLFLIAGVTLVEWYYCGSMLYHHLVRLT
jgi:hypothetical protein